MIFRVRFSVAGAHVHCRLFSAKAPNMSFAKCGDFVVTQGEEFVALLRAMSGVEFIGDDPEKGIIAASRLQEIAEIPDAAIDTSDVPEADESFFQRAQLREPKP